MVVLLGGERWQGGKMRRGGLYSNFEIAGLTVVTQKVIASEKKPLKSPISHRKNMSKQPFSYSCHTIMPPPRLMMVRPQRKKLRLTCPCGCPLYAPRLLNLLTYPQAA
jgi:hypothetical protein